MNRTSSSDHLTPKPATPSADRFIPNRATMNRDVSRYALNNENSGADMMEESSYSSQVAESLFGQDVRVDEHKILALKTKPPAPRAGYQNHLRVLYSQNVGKAAKEKGRAIPTTCERVYDAPGIVDDYYLNLVDWSAQNVLAVALGSSVFLWNATSNNISQIDCAGDSTVTSVSYCPSGPRFLAIGNENNEVQLWDTEKETLLRRLEGHSGRVSSLAWNQHVLSSGSFDSTIINHDVRMQQHGVSTFSRHEGEVCGLKWSPDGTSLASGGNDNLLNIWNLQNSQPLHTLTEHTSAVKALAWCPWQPNLLASGGGTVDRSIKFWNTQTGTVLNSIDTGSQVCSLLWSKTHKEIVSSHGFSKNQLCVWKYPSMVKVAELTGHESRVLHMALSPDGTTVCSASPDESLRFWKIFEQRSQAAKGASSVAGAVPKKVAASSTRGIRSTMNMIR